METFSYKKYIKCIHTMRLNAIMRLAEEKQTYKIIKTEDNYNKKIKDILKDKKEIVSIINNYLHPIEKVKENDLELYDKYYKNKTYVNDEIETVYKWSKKQIFFIIYYQESINHKLTYKILNYCIDFMQDWIKKKNKTNAIYPLLVPIIIYTGSERWKENIYRHNKIELFYNLIEIHKISDKKLIENNNLFGYTMILEKAKDKKDLIKRIKLVMKNIHNEETQIKMNDIIKELLNERSKRNQENGRLKEINRKGDKLNLSNLIERILEEDKKLVKEKEEVIKRQIIENMLKMKFRIEEIEKVTNDSIKNIYKVKKELEST